MANTHEPARMLDLTRSTRVTFEKVSPERVISCDDDDVERITVHLGRALRVGGLIYDAPGTLRRIVAYCGGRRITVDVSGCGVSYTLRFDSFEPATQPPETWVNM